MRYFSSNDVFSFTCPPHDIEHRMKRHRSLKETAAVSRIRYLARRRFGRVQRTTSGASLVKYLNTMNSGALRNDTDDTGIILQIEWDGLSAASYSSPATLCAAASLRMAMRVGIRLNDS